MYVIADERRHGVGLELVRAIIALAEGKVEELTLSVAAHNQPAVSLYRRMGFADYGFGSSRAQSKQQICGPNTDEIAVESGCTKPSVTV
jgi:ribosomal protein S18 acetylase RimI-like enzyme